jgi:prepilin-type N-terminal cleavage/methylation domain-containing protein
MVQPSRKTSAFTLLELVLVLVIISIALAATAPALRGWGKGSRLRASADQFLSVARWARAQSIATGQVYRLNVDAGAGRYWLTVQNGTAFENVGTDFGQLFDVPVGFAISANELESQQALQTLDFFPTGRTQPAWVRITSDDGFALDIKCPSPAEGFSLTSVEEHSL